MAVAASTCVVAGHKDNDDDDDVDVDDDNEDDDDDDNDDDDTDDDDDDDEDDDDDDDDDDDADDDDELARRIKFDRSVNVASSMPRSSLPSDRASSVRFPRSPTSPRRGLFP